MIEVCQTYDLLPTTTPQAFEAWAKDTIGIVLQQKGLVELRANRNLMGSPQIRTTTVWESGEDWARFLEGPWQPMGEQLLKYASNFKIEVWGPSRVVPKPLHPAQ